MLFLKKENINKNKKGRKENKTNTRAVYYSIDFRNVR